MGLAFVDVERGGEIATRLLMCMLIVQDVRRREFYSAMTQANAGVDSRPSTSLIMGWACTLLVCIVRA